MLKRIILAICSLFVAACAGERPKDLGVRDGMLKACPSSPNCVSSQANDEKQRIPALTFKGEPDQAFNRLKQTLVSRSDTTVTETSADYLRAEFRTRMGFVDDGEFLLDRGHSLIHVRSASRLGYSDLGKNRSRMEEIRQQFNGQGLKQ
jgi:uncharacterized protein (DUF1499 family)